MLSAMFRSRALVDELEALLVSDALVLELDLVERERGHRGERDDTGDGEGDSLSMFKRGWSGRVSQVVLASIRVVARSSIRRRVFFTATPAAGRAARARCQRERRARGRFRSANTSKKTCDRGRGRFLARNAYEPRGTAVLLPRKDLSRSRKSSISHLLGHVSLDDDGHLLGLADRGGGDDGLAGEDGGSSGKGSHCVD